MVAALLERILEIALHFAILGALADVALQLHHGRVREAIFHTLIASICIIALAIAGYVAKRLLSKNQSGMHLAITWALTKEKPRAKTQPGAKRVTKTRKPS